MSDIAIRVENLGKQYRIGALQKAGGRHTYKSLRDSIANAAGLPLRAARRLAGKGEPVTSDRAETFWALKNVSFDIKHGEIVGVIGRNGAGKSTLLKLLSRITEPTTGRVEIHGRVGSLLEVGTGFHPELTGRDNVYMNGAILGMKRAEIARQFDEIVTFAEVEKFIDTPVKHYSSGMYLRLAFAVAAHLEPEVLVIDEVLAVGDVEFQKKCLGKMRDVSQNGRTVIFVSHNLNAVRALCDTGLLLQKGRIIKRSPIKEAVEYYLSSGSIHAGSWRRDPLLSSREGILLEELRLGEWENAKGEFNFDEPIGIHIAATVLENIKDVQIVIRVTDQEGVPVFSTCNNDESEGFVPLDKGPLHYYVEIPEKFLSPGRYFLQIAAHTPRIRLYDAIDNEVSFVVHDIGRYAGKPPDDRAGLVNLLLRWHDGIPAITPRVGI